MANDMFVYWGSGSPPSWKVLILLNEKGFQGYGQKLLSFEKKEHKSEEYLKLNPRGQVPTLKHGNIVICESAAACHYLESEFPKKGTKLIPDDPAKKARVLQLMHEAANLQTNATPYAGYLLQTKKENWDLESVKDKKENFLKEMKRWEDILSKSGGSYLTGKDISMADLALYPLLAFLFRVGLQHKSFPRLGAFYDLMSQRPSVKSTWPPHWKESPGQTILADI